MGQYRYDLRKLSEHVQKVKELFSKNGVTLKYAMKANPHPKIIEAMERAGVGAFDTSSLEEMKRIPLGRESESSISGPGKSIRELAYAVDRGIMIEAESLLELERIVQVSRNLGRKAQVALRVQPPVGLNSSMKMSDNWFGIPNEDLEEALELLQKSREEIVFAGLHCFPGSQCLDTESLIRYYREAIPYLFQLYSENRDERVPYESVYINIGGGLGVPYHEGQEPVDVEQIANSIFEASILDYPLVIELGRYLVAEYGEYVVEVVDIKKTSSKTFVVVDGGMNENLAATGNLGQFLRRNYPIRSLDRSSEGAERVTVVGKLCTPLDVLAQDVELNVEVGDRLAIGMSGAYGFTASPQNFLLHPEAEEVFL